jgi:hypothetical protein
MFNKDQQFRVSRPRGSLHFVLCSTISDGPLGRGLSKLFDNRTRSRFVSHFVHAAENLKAPLFSLRINNSLPFNLRHT